MTAGAREADRIEVSGLEPFLGRPVEIEADLVVLATGIVPALSLELAQAYGIDRDEDAFFQEAESKWRPVDALKEGGFCLRYLPVPSQYRRIHRHRRRPRPNGPCGSWPVTG